MNKRQKMEFLMGGDIVIHLSKLCNPTYMKELTEFLLDKGYLKLSTDGHGYDKEDIKGMRPRDKAWDLSSIRYHVRKSFQLTVRTGGFKGSSRGTLIPSTCDEWIPNARYWQETATLMKGWRAIPTYMNFSPGFY